jgi:hypothetical protein
MSSVNMNFTREPLRNRTNRLSKFLHTLSVFPHSGEEPPRAAGLGSRCVSLGVLPAKSRDQCPCTKRVPSARSLDDDIMLHDNRVGWQRSAGDVPESRGLFISPTAERVAHPSCRRLMISHEVHFDRCSAQGKVGAE